MPEFDYAAAMRAYADAINDLALRVSELERQVVAFNRESPGDHDGKLSSIPMPEVWTGPPDPS